MPLCNCILRLDNACNSPLTMHFFAHRVGILWNSSSLIDLCYFCSEQALPAKFTYKEWQYYMYLVWQTKCMNKNHNIMFHTTMILHKSSCTADTTLCTATCVGIMVVRNVATIKTEPHQHTCINQKCVGGTDNCSCTCNHVTRERHAFMIVTVFHVDWLNVGLNNITRPCKVCRKLYNNTILYMYLFTGNATVKLKLVTARSSWPTAGGPVRSTMCS